MSERKFELDGCRIADEECSLTVQRRKSGNISFTADLYGGLTSVEFDLAKVFELYGYLGKIIGAKEQFHQNRCNSCKEPMSNDCPKCQLLWSS